MSRTVKVSLAIIYWVLRCDFISNFQRVLRKYSSIQITFLLMLKKWENALSNKHNFEAVNEKPFKGI